jgi:tellurite resistance protein TehA-like permease
VRVTRDLIAGVSVVFWAFGTWLIPVLVAAGWWRHIRRRIPLRYDATLWSLVFPLGMYAVASIYLGRADELPVVQTIGRGELWVAFTVWMVVFVAMTRHVANTVFRSTPLVTSQGVTGSR